MLNKKRARSTNFGGGSGTTCDSWERHGRRHQTRFGSVTTKGKVCVDDCWVLCSHAEPSSGRCKTYSVAPTPSVHQAAHCTVIALSTLTPPDPSIIIASSKNVQTGNIENSPWKFHAWLQVGRNSDVDALVALFQLHSIVRVQPATRCNSSVLMPA